MASVTSSSVIARAAPAPAAGRRAVCGARPAVARPSLRAAAPRTLRRTTVVAVATDDQAMRAAQDKWEENVRQGRVRNVTGRDIKGLMESGWTVLDVRPQEEVEVVGIKGAVTVPLFEVDDGMDPASLLKQMSAFGMGGWWEGGAHMKPNASFLADVQSKIPKDAKVLVTCQKGLRSLAACEQLSRAGYQEIAWVSGGLDTVRKGEVETTVDKDLRYAGIGGLSSVIGWTEVQVEEKQSQGVSAVLYLAAALLVADLALFAVEQYQYMNTE
mmetsp:Transcript_32728/g.92835  ORF Transcript_32728/g.92835 Transcript_32728/m.92835 type:complete len:271 (+) Transcript_32728:127-939(+)|eukprot:CAMPEP_0117675876 /NCGR_PEP_ID=MMETSP0804-20121206/15850_1 /TAXON_ID=1074897 /ORGANISM="Tetraselmis astigmatica, Strain CCMP880" /LENGTH=270 /DNA_ID=CAMNT_0005484931 /DNA_START=96 /DNA_END=908 /DNA_ORIENTATION=-